MDLTLIDTDLLNFKSANHVDLTLIDTNLNAFATQNTTDLNRPDFQRPEISVRAANGIAYGVVIQSVAVNATETPVLYVNNPSGSGKTIYIVGGFLAADIQSPNWARFFIYNGPTITANGTIQSINNLLAGSGNTSVALAYTLPTASAFGTLMDIVMDGGANSGGNPKSRYHPSSYIIIPPNTKLLITANAKGNNTPIVIILKWFEV